MQLIDDNADFDATPVIRGEKTIREMGAELYAERSWPWRRAS